MRFRYATSIVRNKLIVRLFAGGQAFEKIKPPRKKFVIAEEDKSPDTIELPIQS